MNSNRRERNNPKDPRSARKMRPPVRHTIPEGTKIEYKNLSLLQKYLSDRGKILSRRITGVNAIQQRALARAVKQARFLALLPVGGRKR